MMSPTHLSGEQHLFESRSSCFVEPLHRSIQDSLSAIPEENRSTTTALEALKNLRWSARAGAILSRYVIPIASLILGIGVMLLAANFFSPPFSVLLKIAYKLTLIMGTALIALPVFNWVTAFIAPDLSFLKNIADVCEEQQKILEEWISKVQEAIQQKNPVEIEIRTDRFNLALKKFSFNPEQ